MEKFKMLIDKKCLLLKDTNIILDSMCFDSDTDICEYTDGTYTLWVKVMGEVRVTYNGETYRCFSRMPEELQNMFLTGELDYEKVYIENNNWYEFCFFRETERVILYSDVFNIDGMDVNDLEKECKKELQECIKWFEESNND